MDNDKILELREKFLKGIELVFEKLVKTKQKNDMELENKRDIPFL